MSPRPPRRRPAGRGIFPGAALGVLAPLAAMAAGASVATAQAPVPTGWAGASAGMVWYDLPGGADGREFGVAGSFRAGAIEGVLAVARVDLLDGPLSPTVARVRLGRAVGSVSGWSVSLVGHGGLSLVTGDDDATILAGGAGLQFERPLLDGVQAVGFRAEARGLAATVTGSLAGLAVSATGLSLGVELGLHARAGPLAVAVAGTADGFAGALGPTPFPARAVRLSAGYRF